MNRINTIKHILVKLFSIVGIDIRRQKNIFPEEREQALKYFFSSREGANIKKRKRFQTGEASFLGRKLIYNDNSALLGMLHEIFMKDNYKFEADSNKPLIIDCGANIGLSVIYFKSLYPNCSITAVEPDPFAFKSLKKNLTSYQLNDVILLNNAIWINKGELVFQSDKSWGGFVGEDEEDLINNKAYKVKGIDLNELLTQDVDFLKLDIEGAETDVLLHAKERIVKYVKNLFFEWHSLNGQPQRLGEILDYFGNHGFRYHIKEASSKNSPFIEKRQDARMDSQLDCFLYKI